LEKDLKERNSNELIYENRVKSGKRTYFFDAKKTNEGSPCLEITESRKQDEGKLKERI